MRISDWSSDVCSSDLADAAMPCLFGNKAERSHARLGVDLKEIKAFHALAVVPAKIGARAALAAQRLVRGQGHVHRRLRHEIGSASCRKSVSVRVALGGRRIIKTKNKRYYTRKTTH